jgi:hypothetical protein
MFGGLRLSFFRVAYHFLCTTVTSIVLYVETVNFLREVGQCGAIAATESARRPAMREMIIL